MSGGNDLHRLPATALLATWLVIAFGNRAARKEIFQARDILRAIRSAVFVRKTGYAPSVGIVRCLYWGHAMRVRNYGPPVNDSRSRIDRSRSVARVTHEMVSIQSK